ncbi:hypothetical protein GC176_05635 [bacterium]|nr:hypothetical protein [bacterium]
MRHIFNSAGRLSAIVSVWTIIGYLTVDTALAHEGPPFPILMDEPLASYKVSVWADPDIGEATFYVVVETPDGAIPQTEPQVTLWVEPVSGRLDRVGLPGRRQSLRNRMQFEMNPYFDQRDQWNVGIRIDVMGGEAQELVTQVESTPPGLGVWDFVIYLFPFVLFGGLWVVGLVRGRGRSSIQSGKGRLAEAEPESHADQPLLGSATSESERSPNAAEVRS